MGNTSAWVWDGIMTLRVGLTDTLLIPVRTGFNSPRRWCRMKRGRSRDSPYRFTNATQDIGRDAWVWE